MTRDLIDAQVVSLFVNTDQTGISEVIAYEKFRYENHSQKCSIILPGIPSKKFTCQCKFLITRSMTKTLQGTDEKWSDARTKSKKPYAIAIWSSWERLGGPCLGCLLVSEIQTLRRRKPLREQEKPSKQYFWWCQSIVGSG